MENRVMRGRSLVLVPLLMLTAACQPTPLEAGTSASPQEAAAAHESRLQAAFAELQQKNLSVVVGIAHDGGPIVLREFGAAARDSVPPGATQVDINSITKTVTAVATLKLVAQGKLRLQETLAELLPNVPKDKAGITVHQLLTHTAGLVDGVGPDPEQLGKEAFLERLFATKLRGAPGKKWRYSNAGYSVLAAIIEARSGKAYDEYLQQDVLANTGLKNTGYLSVYDESRSLKSADGRAVMAASWGGHEPYWNLLGNGGLISTAEDFIRFLQMLKAGEIIPPELVQESRRPLAAMEDDDSKYGYGLVVMEQPRGGVMYWHDGGNPVFSAMWADVPAHEDIIFTAGADDRSGNAFDAMRVMRKHLHGIKGD